MTGSILFTSYLVFAPPPPPTDFDVQFERSEAVAGEDELQLIAYDRAGEVIGTIAFWVEPDGATGVLSDYGDGYAVVLISPEGEVHTDTTLPREVVSERADLIASHLDPYDPQEAKWVACAGLTGIMVATCGAGNIWACPFTAIMAACECLPKLEPKWKNKRCTA